MYTIKQAGLRSGVSVPLLRAWERRYEIVRPARTAAGYRLYDDAAVDRLRAMRRLVDEGWAPSEAARAVRAGDVPPDAGARTATPAGILDRPEGGTRTGPPASDLAAGLLGQFVEAATRMDPQRLELVLDEAFAAGSFEHATESIVLPALRALGDAWHAGTLDVAAEHAASHAVGRRLAAAFAAAGAPVAASDVLVGLPPGSRHELGALAVATAARRAGMAVLYLGADVPESAWVEAVARTAARAVVLAVPTRLDADPAGRVLDRLGAGDGTPMLAVGGSGVGALRTDAQVVLLPASVSQAAGVLRERLAAGGSVGS